MNLFGHKNLLKEQEVNEPGDKASYSFICTCGVSTFTDLLHMVTPFVQKYP